MAEQASGTADQGPTAPLAHGGRVLPAVTVDTYNEELRDEEGFVGDRASRRAFRSILADWRDRLKEHGRVPVVSWPFDRNALLASLDWATKCRPAQWQYPVPPPQSAWPRVFPQL